jgi:hypothetical protein
MDDAVVRSHRHAMLKQGGKGGTSSGTNTPLRQLRKRAGGGGVGHPSRGLERSSSAPARIRDRRARHLLVEDHYRVDPDNKTLLPGLPINDDEDVIRHDFFNLIALVPVVVLNVLNWNWDALLDPNSKVTMQQAWTGEWFPIFYAITIGYFVADLIWVLLVPHCVKSPGVIIQHHVATLLYLIIPYKYPEDGWLMGACLSVEVNTWLLIARRVFNKQGFGPWVINLSCLSIRIKLISIMFYITWFFIRCYIYPLIMKVLFGLLLADLEKMSIFRSHYMIALPLQSVFCVLNLKWTLDLFMSKFRAMKSGGATKVEKGL